VTQIIDDISTKVAWDRIKDLFSIRDLVISTTITVALNIIYRGM